MPALRIERAELRVVELPLLHPFQTSFGTETHRRCVLVRLECEGVHGWGECVAMEGPWYSTETTGTAWHLLRDFLVPMALQRPWSAASELAHSLGRVRGNEMARAALEGAYWDALARAHDVPLATLLGGTRSEIECGVSIGIQPSTATLLETVESELRSGYRRIKLKIEPGHDLEPVAAVRERFPTTPLMADANSAYTLPDAAHLARLDAYELMMLEQPLGHDDIVDHASLATQLSTPICLDESIHSAAHARHALDLGACSIVNIKSGRVGGLCEAVRIHDLCAGRQAPVWCGGMLETNIGRAHNVALSSLPGFTLPGDVAASRRYFEWDIAFPDFEVSEDGTMAVPERPGCGVDVDESRLDQITLQRETIRP